jgi:hypothetical protein
VSIAIALSFPNAFARLTGDEQKAVKTTAFDLQINPDSPGLSFHKLDRACDKHFWSVRVSQDIRIIVHKDGDSLLLCYYTTTIRPTPGRTAEIGGTPDHRGRPAR